MKRYRQEQARLHKHARSLATDTVAKTDGDYILSLGLNVLKVLYTKYFSYTNGYDAK
jgi:hypothetical protein